MGDEVTLGQVFRGTMGFLLTDFLTLAIIIAFPILSLWLPGAAQ
jgi:TRAP-type mannitol/chloroaromatic compound transport system permease large subunit